MNVAKFFFSGLAFMALAACTGQQSALSGGGIESDRTLVLTIILSVGSAVIFLLVIAALVISMTGPRTLKRLLSSHSMVVHGGITFPIVVLSVLLTYGFVALGAGPASSAEDGKDPLVIQVEGLQWWWRVTYLDEEGIPVESANEIRLPTGRSVKMELSSGDVIHSLWIPAFAGKVDMIPGHTNTLSLVARKPGIFRGQCTEYCGGAHALMSFPVVSMTDEDFQDWFDREALPAQNTGSPGERLFLSAGCGGCHTVRGTSASGRVGPDLTHVASRRTLGAGVLETDYDAFYAWLDAHHEIKPGNLMPRYEFLTDADRAALASYLMELE